MADVRNQPRVVVFGGIGSGKSTFTDLLARRGAVVIEADRIGHEILRPEGAAFSEVSSRWPGAVVGGQIDRARLGEIVFADPAALEALEAITHPLIGDEIRRRAESAGSAPVVLELPLVVDLVGQSWIWVLIDTPEEIRIARAVARGAAEDDVVARIRSQPTDVEYHERADWIVPNTGSARALEAAADELWDTLNEP